VRKEDPMELHRGRLIDHIQLRCANLAASKRFYAAALGVLGVPLTELAPGLIVADELCLTPANADPVSHMHLAFQTESRDQVARFHAAARYEELIRVRTTLADIQSRLIVFDYLITNAETEQAAVVYRRDDGDVGLIDAG
jgi:catechol 2,3-dioxygenase-like lactoylglutathione lyase family enzyme